MYKDTKRPTDTEIAWFAGLFDGEGHIQIQNPVGNKSYRLFLRLHMTHFSTVQRAKEIWGIGSLNIVEHKSYKPSLLWLVAGNKAGQILELCLPYLVTKREEANIAIAFQNYRRKKHYQRRTPAILSEEEKFANLIVQCRSGDLYLS